MIRDTSQHRRPAARLGCAPGSNCCDECRSHPPATLRGFLGDTGANYDPTDPTSDNYDPGAVTAPAAASSSGPSKNILLYVGIGLAAVFLLESTSRRR